MSNVQSPAHFEGDQKITFCAPLTLMSVFFLAVGNHGPEVQGRDLGFPLALS